MLNEHAAARVSRVCNVAGVWRQIPEGINVSSETHLTRKSANPMPGLAVLNFRPRLPI
jgi:hypothetical protein